MGSPQQEGPGGSAHAPVEDTIDMGDRHDPVRALLRRVAAGDASARTALVDAVGARIHGLALHVTDSSRRAERLTIQVLRACMDDAGTLAIGILPAETAVLDRARRMIIPAAGTGTIRSLVTRDTAHQDRTRSRHEVELVRILLSLDPADRALFEGAAQGRFTVTRPQRQAAALSIARVLDMILPASAPIPESSRALIALDALALTTPVEQEQLAGVCAGPDAPRARLLAIEAAARLTSLTSTEPTRDLRAAVLVFPDRAADTAGSTQAVGPAEPPAQHTPPPRPAPGVQSLSAGSPEPAYRGTYDTPVLGTDTNRRMVGPPALIGASVTAPAGPIGTGATGTDPTSTGARSTDAAPAPSTTANALTPDPSPTHPGPPAPAASGDASAALENGPTFGFTKRDEATHERRAQRRERRRGEPTRSRSRSWTSRVLSIVLALGLAVTGWFLYREHQLAQHAQALTSTWAHLSSTPDARVLRGHSDNGQWRAVLSPQGYALVGEDVTGYDGEVLQLWGVHDGRSVDLGVIEIQRDGSVHVSGSERVDSLTVTREHRPRNQSGTPSERVVATIDPAAPAS